MRGAEHASGDAIYGRHARKRPPRSRAGLVGAALPVLLLGCPADSSAVSIHNGLVPFDAPFGQSAAARQSATAIELTEQSRVALPAGRQLLGAVLSPSGALIAAWFRGFPGVRVYHGVAATDILLRDVGQAIGVGFLDEERLEIVDAAGGDIVVADTAGRVVSRRRLQRLAGAGAAARTASGWFLAFPDSSPPVFQLPAGRGLWTPDSTYTRAVSLGSGDAEALVWQSFSPFRAWRIGAGTHWLPVEFQQVSPDWFDEDVAGSVRLNPGIWSATSVVSIGPGYVQTLADRGTDRRLLLWFDSHGRFVRHGTIDAPFGFVASGTESCIVLAVRTLNTIELVKYYWEEVPDSMEATAKRRKR